MILHCVFLRFKASLSPEEKSALFEALVALKEQIPGIMQIQHGPNVSPEGLSGGFRDGFIVRFENSDARDAYLVHPEHVALGDRLVAACDGGLAGLMVFDFET